MTRRTALQIDHPSKLSFATDTSIMLGIEAQKRGYELWCYEPHALSWREGNLTATMQRLKLHNDTYELGEPNQIETAEMNVIWMRQDPPFDMAYITATHLLEHAGTRVVNDPVSVRNAPEKLSILHFAEFIPETLISADEATILAFAREHKSIIGKPLHGHGGRSVFKFDANDGNLTTFLELWRERSREPLMWQRFLPEVKSGDRRILLIDGEVKSCFGRIPGENSIRANTRIHGLDSVIKAEPTSRQIDIAERVGKMAKEQGLLIVGLDVIGDYLTEINVTSPTGLRISERLYNQNLAKDCWDVIEK